MYLKRYNVRTRVILGGALKKADACVPYASLMNTSLATIFAVEAMMLCLLLDVDLGVIEP